MADSETTLNIGVSSGSGLFVILLMSAVIGDQKFCLKKRQANICKNTKATHLISTFLESSYKGLQGRRKKLALK